MRGMLAAALVVSLFTLEAVHAQGSGPLTLEVVARVSGRFAAPAGSAEPGFEVELLRRFAGWHRVKQGREVALEYRYVPVVPTLLEAIQGGADVGLGGITATPERDRVVDFSAAVLPVRSVLVAPAGVLDAARWRQQIKGLRLGAPQGSTNAAEVERVAGEIAGVRVESALATNEDVFAALGASPRRLDAAIVDLPQYWTLGKARGVVVVDNIGPPQSIAFVLPQGSPLKRTLDAFLDEFTHSSEYFVLVRKYFGNDAEQMVRISRGSGR
jgi:ABC-type amino acid transport substrate-binding protein